MYFRKECESDNYEYKKHIIYMDSDKLEHYKTQLNFRLLIGNGLAYFVIGVHDSGRLCGLQFSAITKSISNVYLMCKGLNSKMNKVSIIKINKKKFIAIIEITSTEEKYIDPPFLTYSMSDSESEFD